MAFPDKALAFILVGFVSCQVNAEASQAEYPSANKSPYFIDAVHCEGLVTAETDEDQFRDKAAAAIGTRSLRQKYCEEVFHSFGLRKFEWRTTEDLEMLAYAIRNSNRYQGFELSIQKSQLQNHVHVFGQFAEFESKMHFNSSALLRFDGKRGQAGPRRIVDIEAGLELQRRGPANYPSGILSIRSLNSQAKDALTAEDIDDKKNGTLILRPDDQVALSKRNESLQILKYKVFLRRTSVSRLFADLGFYNQKLSGDEVSEADQHAEVGYSLDNDDTDLFIGSTLTTWTGSVLYSTYVAFPYESIDADKVGDRGKDVVFGGIKQDSRSRSLIFSWSYYRSVTNAVRYFGDINVIWTFAESGRYGHSLGFMNSVIKRPILPEHRFSLDSQSSGQAFYKIESSLPTSSGEHAVELKLGVEHVLYEAKREDSAERKRDGIPLLTPIVELNYNLKLETMEAQLGVVYAAQRSR